MIVKLSQVMPKRSLEFYSNLTPNWKNRLELIIVHHLCVVLNLPLAQRSPLHLGRLSHNNVFAIPMYAMF